MQRGAQLSLAGDNADIVSQPEGHMVWLKHHGFYRAWPVGKSHFRRKAVIPDALAVLGA